jgi:hypothetical protein
MKTLADRYFPRRRVVLVCKIGTALSLFATVVAFVIPTSIFVLQLAACFMFFLFAFHWLFGAIKSLTVTHARLIDYAYLGIAASGVFVLALNYQDKREEYVGTGEMAAAYASRREQHKNFVQSVTELERVSCESAVVTLMPSYCEPAKALRTVALKEYDAKTLEDAVQLFLKAAPPPDLIDRERSAAYQPIVLKIQEVQLDVLGLKNDDQHIELNKPMKREAGEYAYDFYILFTWPFILAFAFALRITKTTIEVLEWTTGVPAETTAPAVVGDSSVFPLGEPPAFLASGSLKSGRPTTE